MDDLELVTCCGLYCGLCGHRNRTPIQAGTLRQTMQKEGWDVWGNDDPGFKEFWSYLGRLTELAPSCRKGCGPPFCTIRKCVQERKLDACPFCDEYPCQRVQGIAAGYPTMVADGRRMKAKGVKAWVQEQEERRKTGFAYVDIRTPPYHVPDK